MDKSRGHHSKTKNPETKLQEKFQTGDRVSSAVWDTFRKHPLLKTGQGGMWKDVVNTTILSCPTLLPQMYTFIHKQPCSH